jgi:hypothetical protein
MAYYKTIGADLHPEGTDPCIKGMFATVDGG